VTGYSFFAGFVVGVVVTTAGVSGLLLWLNRPKRQSARAILRDKEFHDYFTGRK
jgi:hypothetical protein